MHVSCLPDEALHTLRTAWSSARREVLWACAATGLPENALSRSIAMETNLPSIGHLPAPDTGNCIARRITCPCHMFETTRGCPLDCEILRRDSAFGGRYRNRSPEEVVTELRVCGPSRDWLTLKNCVSSWTTTSSAIAPTPEIFCAHLPPQAELVRAVLDEHRQRSGDFEALREKRLHRIFNRV